MNQAPEALLESGLRTLGIHGEADVAAKFLKFGSLVLEENRRTNLTGARDLGTVVGEHILDSLAPLELVDLVSPIVDVGSGAGFPGIPAAIAFPKKDFVLLEPRAKRAAFLTFAAKELELNNVCVIKSSARGPGAAHLKGRAGTVLMRAVAEPVTSIALGLPLLKPGGQMLLYEGRSSRPTAEQRRAAKGAGCEVKVIRVAVPSSTAVRHAWVFRPSRPPKRR